MSKLCMICCFSYTPTESECEDAAVNNPEDNSAEPTTTDAKNISSKISAKEDPYFNKFCEQINLNENGQPLAPPREEGGGGGGEGRGASWKYALLKHLDSWEAISVCPGCLSFISNAAKIKEEMEEIEDRLRQIQKDLRDRQENYYGEMTKLRKTVKEADVHCLKAHLDNLAEGQVTVTLFREKIIYAVECLDKAYKESETDEVVISDNEEDTSKPIPEVLHINLDAEGELEYDEGDCVDGTAVQFIFDDTNGEFLNEMTTINSTSTSMTHVVLNGTSSDGSGVLKQAYSQQFLECTKSLDLENFLPLKQEVLQRLIDKANQISDDLAPETDSDSPEANFLFGYSKATGNITVHGTEILFSEDEKSLRCSLCDFSAARENPDSPESAVRTIENLIQDHILQQHLNFYKCSQCSSTFSTYDLCTKHLEDAHTNSISCGQCSKKFTTDNALLEHMDECTGGSRANDGDQSQSESPSTHLHVVDFKDITEQNQSEEDDDIQVLEEVPPKKASNLTNVESAVQFALFMSSANLAGMPVWKQSILLRILNRANKILANEDDEYPDGDLRKNFFFDYNQTTNNISVGGVDIFINELNESFDCSSCGFSIGVHQGVHVEKGIHDHILGTHLKVYRCSMCAAALLSYGAYQQHLVKGHTGSGSDGNGSMVLFGVNACDVCGNTSFSSEDELWKHKRRFHSGWGWGSAQNKGKRRKV